MRVTRYARCTSCRRCNTNHSIQGGIQMSEEVNEEAVAMVRVRGLEYEVPRAVAVSTWISLRELLKDNPIALYELATKAHDREHIMWGGAAQAAVAYGLMAAPGESEDTVRWALIKAMTRADGSGGALIPIEKVVDGL